MNLTELKYTIERVEDYESGIKRLEKFKNKELVIASPDFSDKEQDKLYISGERANEIIDFMIQEQKDFLKPHKEVLDKVLALIKED